MEYYEFLSKEIYPGDVVTTAEGEQVVVEDVVNEDQHEDGAGILTYEGEHVPHGEILEVNGNGIWKGKRSKRKTRNYRKYV